MDPLTHTLFGGAMASTGLRRLTPLATATLVVGANLPDLDVLAYAEGSDASLAWRRGWTHGAVAMVVLPIVLTLLVLALDRLLQYLARRRGEEREAVRPAWLLILAALSVWSHPLLDWLNTYGVRLLMPFSGQWFYGDALYIIDPWMWLLLGGALFLGHSARPRGIASWTTLAALTTLAVLGGAGFPSLPGIFWIGSLLGLALWRWRHVDPADTGAIHRRSRLALAGFVLYALFMVATSRYAEHQIRTELGAHDIPATSRMLVGPVVIDALERDVLVELEDHYRAGSWHWLRSPRFALDPEPLLKRGSGPTVATALGAACVHGFVEWMRFPFYEIEETADGGRVVHLLDARYVRRRVPGFGATAVQLDAEGEPEDCRPPRI